MTVTNNIDKELKSSIDHATNSLEIDMYNFRYHPEIVQQERAHYAKNHPSPPPADINITDLYISSSKDGNPIRLRVYQPDSFVKNQVILYFHGGGYVFGLPEQVDEQMYILASRTKATIISADYRLSPQYHFPVPILDGYDALMWLIKNGEKVLHIHTGNITVFGASAGGHLAAAVTQMAVDNKIDNIKHQFLLYPVIHNKLNTPSMKTFTNVPLWNTGYATIAWEHFLGKENLRKSIRYADLTLFDKFHQLPPTTIVACELDPLRDEDIEYAQLLYKAGVKTALWVIPGALHIFDMFPSHLTNEFYHFFTQRMQYVNVSAGIQE